MKLSIINLFCLATFAISSTDQQDKEKFCELFNAWFASYKSQPIETSRIKVDVDPDITVEVVNHQQYVRKEHCRAASIFSLEAPGSKIFYRNINEANSAAQKTVPFIAQNKDTFIDYCKACCQMSEAELVRFQKTLTILERNNRKEIVRDRYQRSKITSEEQNELFDEWLALEKEITKLKNDL